VLAEDVRAPIVYLRPFGADQAKIANRWSSRLRISPREGLVSFGVRHRSNEGGGVKTSIVAT
jgi:hypothetical protein